MDEPTRTPLTWRKAHGLAPLETGDGLYTGEERITLYRGRSLFLCIWSLPADRPWKTGELFDHWIELWERHGGSVDQHASFRIDPQTLRATLQKPNPLIRLAIDADGMKDALDGLVDGAWDALLRRAAESENRRIADGAPVSEAGISIRQKSAV